MVKKREMKEERATSPFITQLCFLHVTTLIGAEIWEINFLLKKKRVVLFNQQKIQKQRNTLDNSQILKIIYFSSKSLQPNNPNECKISTTLISYLKYYSLS